MFHRIYEFLEGWDKYRQSRGPYREGGRRGGIQCGGAAAARWARENLHGHCYTQSHRQAISCPRRPGRCPPAPLEVISLCLFFSLHEWDLFPRLSYQRLHRPCFTAFFSALSWKTQISLVSHSAMTTSLRSFALLIDLPVLRSTLITIHLNNYSQELAGILSVKSEMGAQSWWSGMSDLVPLNPVWGPNLCILILKHLSDWQHPAPESSGPPLESTEACEISHAHRN